MRKPKWRLVEIYDGDVLVGLRTEALGFFGFGYNKISETFEPWEFEIQRRTVESLNKKEEQKRALRRKNLTEKIVE